jgi:hypothetical protein
VSRNRSLWFSVGYLLAVAVIVLLIVLLVLSVGVVACLGGFGTPVHATSAPYRVVGLDRREPVSRSRFPRATTHRD